MKYVGFIVNTVRQPLHAGFIATGTRLAQETDENQTGKKKHGQVKSRQPFDNDKTISHHSLIIHIGAQLALALPRTQLHPAQDGVFLITSNYEQTRYKITKLYKAACRAFGRISTGRSVG
ncbi:MAG: hypothetical protein KGS72_07020 [Cyanobacteria bacterium REEB67]|nr:hypothetical protein [Cyanobacteria bacterium REEB67]